MIMAETEEDRRAALDELLPLQQEDFEGLFEEMAGCRSRSGCSTRRCTSSSHRPRTSRAEVERARIERPTTSSSSSARSTASARSRRPTRCSAPAACGWASCTPRSTRCRCEAIVRAARGARASEPPHVEIMIPLVAYEKELELMRELVERIVREEDGEGMDLPIGTMIELPRACFVADRIAAHADFFSFGTNDLTQTALGLLARRRRGPLPHPLHRAQGPRPLAVRDDRQARGRAGSCGWRPGSGARPSPTSSSASAASTAATPTRSGSSSIAGLDYVSCSPYRVPIARVAAAQAALAL